MIKNGRPLSIESRYKQDDALITVLSPDDMNKVIHWVSTMLAPRKTPNESHTSYGIKHLLTHDTNVYVTNNQFKDAMLMCGHWPIDADALHWHYRISEKSPAFDWKLRAARDEGISKAEFEHQRRYERKMRRRDIKLWHKRYGDDVPYMNEATLEKQRALALEQATQAQGR